MLRPFLLFYVTIDAQTMHGLVAVVPIVAACALLYPVRIALFMMAKNALYPGILMGLVGKPDGTDGAFHRWNPVGCLAMSGGLCNGYHIGVFFPHNPGIKAAGTYHESCQGDK